MGNYFEFVIEFINENFDIYHIKEDEGWLDKCYFTPKTDIGQLCVDEMRDGPAPNPDYRIKTKSGEIPLYSWRYGIENVLRKFYNIEHVLIHLYIRHAIIYHTKHIEFELSQSTGDIFFQ
jgi:hypothetical protein